MVIAGVVHFGAWGRPVFSLALGLPCVDLSARRSGSNKHCRRAGRDLIGAWSQQLKASSCRSCLPGDSVISPLSGRRQHTMAPDILESARSGLVVRLRGNS